MPQMRIALTVTVDVPDAVADVYGARVIADAHIGISIYKPDKNYGKPLWSGKAVPRVTGVERE